MVLLKVTSLDPPAGNDVHTKDFRKTNRFSGRSSNLESA